MARTITTVNDAIQSASTNVGGTRFTLAAWWKPNAAPGTANTSAVFGYQNGSGATNCELVWDNATGLAGTQEWFFHSNSGSFPTVNYTGTFTGGTWYHIAASWDGTNLVIYKNGTQNASVGGDAGPPNTNASNFFAGKGPAGADGALGSLSDVAWWTATLTAGEIAALAAGVRAYNIRQGSLNAYMPLWGLTSPETDQTPGGGFTKTYTLTGTTPANDPPLTLWTPKAYSFPQPIVIAGDTLIGRQQLRFM